MHCAKLTVNCVQASFNLGHTVDTTKPIEWPVGVEMQRVDHLTDDRRVGAMSKLPKLIIKFLEPAMATVIIYASGKVDVSCASSERAAQVAADKVRDALRRPGDEDDWERDFAGCITQIIATYAVLPKVIKQQELYFQLNKQYSSVEFEPEIRHCVRLMLNQGATGGVSKGRVFIEFFHGTIVVRGVGLGAGGSDLMQERFREVFDKVRIDDLLSAANPKAVKSKQQVPDARDALDKAIKKMVGGGPLKGLGRRPPGGFTTRHHQIQKWLQEEHPNLKLPDYAWGNPGRVNPQVWAGTPWAGFWTEHMCPVFDEMAEQKNLKRKREEQDPAEESKTLYHMADSLVDSNMTNTESSADATSRLDKYGAVVLLAEERERQHDQLFEAALQDERDELEVPVSRSVADQVDGAEEQPKGAYCSLCSGDDESAGARRATTGRILPWPSTARHRSYTGVEVPPGTKLTVGEANEAPSDVASRVLQALGAFACPEMADLHNECVRICKLIIAN